MDESSILTSIKKLIGITEDYEQFDQDIIMHINSVFVILNQLGIGPEEGFYIKDKTKCWADFIADKIKLNHIKTYMYLKVRLMFDPPTASVVADSMNRMISELEWRIQINESFQE